ncbi:MAG: hypothetical protein RLO51_13575 [Thalassobaculum sp.]|uniref:hypothetical protein n=1 Tax=Thalassobaculum sp. TaxID=2022740 RepID=UPI0032ED9072
MNAADLGPLLARVPNLPLPTLGGRHFWADLAIAPSHRIQRHVWTGHCRLLDGGDRRRAFGTYAHCRTAAKRLPPAPTAAGTLVVMLHGLYRSRHCLRTLERRIQGSGLDVVAPNYPSGHADLAALGAWLNDLMAGFRGYRQVVFVTYSLGGLVLRSALAGDCGWRHRMTVAGIVQIGPPNRGARAAEIIRALPPGNRVTGPAARMLCDPLDLPEPPSGIPVLVIAGGTGRHGFNPWLDGDDDGVVRVAETRLDRPHDFRRLPTLHGLLVRHPETARLVRAAIDRWGSAEQADPDRSG